MEDLLDLNWSSTTSKLKDNKKQQSVQKKDAFADLLAIGSNSKEDEKPTLSSLAEQKRHQHQAWATATRSEPLTPTKHTPSQLTPPPSQPASTHSSKPVSFDDLLNPFGTSNKSNSGKSTPLNQLRNNAKPTTPTPTGSSEQWNFDLLDTLPAEKSSNTVPIGDDIFGDLTQESQTVSANGSSYVQHIGYDEDNPLGILAEPVQSMPVDFEVDEPSAQLDEPEIVLSHQDTLKEEEEDEMLARLIDMGFSMQQSKFAMEATGGHDLQAAIDLLMQSSEPAQRYQSRIPDNSHNNRHQPSPTEQARNALFTTKSNGQQQQRQGVDDMLHVQTEKIVGQAQELGGMLYKNAASFIKLGRERVTKAVGDWQEQQRVQRLKQLQEQQKGPVRPKWMTVENETVDLSTASVEKFADDDMVYEKKKPEQPVRSASGTPKMRQQQRQPRTRALIGDEDESVYVSPSRRKPTPTSSGRSTPQSAMAGSVRQESTVFAPKPKQRTRPVVNASADIIAKVKQAKEQGNEKYKLGQFGEAEEAYTRAIELLPAGHDHQVILCNNRAMARLKIGDYKKCIEDCDLAITLCKESGEGSDVSEGVAISWRDQLLKSLNRKAEALENIERYKDALNVYEEIVKVEGSGNVKTNQSMSRCRQALNPKPTRSPPTARVEAPEKKQDFMSMFDPSSAPTVKEPTVSAEELSKSKAVAEIRAKAAEKEAEDAERLSKTDDINARLVAWKAGKEQNLRALLATLDTLLWPEAQWKGAQMSDLIDVKKCKIIYMKAISKVHPDKLPSNASVEQKMLASGIFATLNEAWDAFKLQCF